MLFGVCVAPFSGCQRCTLLSIIQNSDSRSVAIQVRQSVAHEAGITVEELAPDAEGLTEALDECKRMHKRRHAAASILQVWY